MSRSLLLYCDDILDAIEAVRDYVRGIAFDECADDPMRADAVPYRLVIVGEAVGQIPKAVREPGGDEPGGRPPRPGSGGSDPGAARRRGTSAVAPDEVTHHRRGPGIERRDPAVRSSARWKTGRCPYDSRIARSLLSWLERESVFSDGCHSVPGGARGLSGVEPHGRDGSATSRPPAGAHGDAGLSSLGGRTPPPSGPGPRAAPEVRRGRSRVLQDHTERTSCDHRVIGNGRRPSKWMAEVDVTAFPVPDRLARPAERPSRVPSREDRECRGHRRTATRYSPAPLGQRGMPSRARDPRCSPIASAMFRFASSLVRPCETQPGRDGTVTTYRPSSSRSIRISNSIAV